MSDYVLGTYVPNAVAPIRSWDAEVLRKNVYDCVRRQKQYSRMAPYAHRDYLHMLLSYLKQLLQRFYFRPELGYAIGFGNNEIEATYTAPDGTTTTETEEVPGLLIGGFIGNIGIGFAF